MMHVGEREPESAEEDAEAQPEEPVPGSWRRGFAMLRPERRRLISSKGGRAAHKKGSAHQFTPEEARAAGKKGGQASAKSRAKKA